MHGAKVFLQKFFARYGMIFVAVYFVSFFLLITFAGGTNIQTYPGDVRLEIAESVVYLPFTSSFAFAIVATLLYQAYKVLKGN